MRFRAIQASVFVFAVVAAVVVACGGNGGGEEVGSAARLVLQADLSALPAGADTASVMALVEHAVTRRLEEYGTPPVSMERQGADELVVTLDVAISEEEAGDLLKPTAKLAFRQPVLDAGGQIVCRSLQGEEFSMPPEAVTYAREDLQALPVCTGPAGQVGEIVWEPAKAASQGDAPVVVVPLTATVDRIEAPILVVTFTQESGDLLHEITTGLVGLPFGIFLDGALVAGPTLSAPVTTANLAIPGLSLHQANILEAQFNGGDLPVPVNVVSVEVGP